MLTAHDRMLESLAERIHAIAPSSIVRVGIDGEAGVGKTTLGDALCRRLERDGRTVIRSTIDNFHNPRATRYARGRHSPEGFFYDSHDLAGVKRVLLDPLSPSGSRMYRTAMFNCETDRSVEMTEARANDGDILVFDGIFLHRPELASYWDFSIFLAVDFRIAMERGAQRGPDYGSPDPDTPQNRRYVEGQRLYVRSHSPERLASIVINYDDLENPYVLEEGSEAGKMF